MQLFNKIMSKIFGSGASQPSASSASSAAAPAASNSSAPATATVGAGAATNPGAGTATPAAGPSVDVNAVLNEMAAKNSEKLDWRKSIVDLMKLVGMDSSLSARKQLATELGYTGDQNDSAKMNMWLHKQVLRKLAENGGRVPQELLD
jgi:hypothetical protein